jgi:hypothetical protein
MTGTIGANPPEHLLREDECLQKQHPASSHANPRLKVISNWADFIQLTAWCQFSFPVTPQKTQAVLELLIYM